MKDIYIVIPVYNPEEDLTIGFIKELEKKFQNIIIVNDGCTNVGENYFNNFKKHIVLTHSVNQGKGRAMKTAFNYLLTNVKNFKGAVVADCDAQHSVSDILKICKEVEKNENALVLGVRDFDSDHVPLRSKLGNKITRFVFQVFIGLGIKDTQTGLRGYSKKLMPVFLKTSGERYEFETNMLIKAKELDVPIKEIPIETIYIEGNKGSHFDTIKDSFIIYKLFFKYIIASVFSFVIDITLFYLLFLTNIGVVLSTIGARIISSFFNYKINQSLIFKKKDKHSFYKYIMLVLFSMFSSAILVKILSTGVHFPIVIVKIIVDAIIFILNFIIQREWVFRKN